VSADSYALLSEPPRPAYTACPIEREAPHDHKPCGAALILTSSHLYVRHSKRTFERLSTAEKAFLITAEVALLAPRIAATHSEPLTLTDRPVMPSKRRERHPRTFSGYQRLRLVAPLCGRLSLYLVGSLLVHLGLGRLIASRRLRWDRLSLRFLLWCAHSDTIAHAPISACISLSSVDRARASNS
jgi:hypothetical protein